MAIRAIRESLRMSQKDLAAALGVSPPAVNKWETGKSDPTLANLRAMAALFGCTLDELTRESLPAPPAIEAAS